MAVALQAGGDVEGAALAYRSAARLMAQPPSVVLLNLLRCTLESARWQHWPLLEWYATRETVGTTGAPARAGSAEERGGWPWAKLEARAFLTGVPKLLHQAAAVEAHAVLADAAVPWRCGTRCGSKAARRTRLGRGPLRISLLSNLDADPSASLLTTALPLLHDRRRGLDLRLLSFNDRQPSEYLETIAQHVPTRWLPAHPPTVADGRPPEPACEAQDALVEAAPHIVLEAMAYLPGQRLELLERRCTRAPVTLSLLRNFHGSMVASFVDYALADRVALPPRLAAAYTEAVVLLPHAHLVNAHAAMLRARGRAPPAHWPRGAPIACSLNRLNKLEPT
eukprot:5914447-Prymnesium_polylepis.1